MASKNDARYGIDCSLVRQPNAMSGIVIRLHGWHQKAHYFHAVITYSPWAFPPSNAPND